MPAAPYWRGTELLVVRRNMHLPDREIARVLVGRSPKAIAAFRVANGLRKRRRLGFRAAEERAARIVEMYHADIDPRDIARRVGCCASAVDAALARAGIGYMRAGFAGAEKGRVEST